MSAKLLYNLSDENPNLNKQFGCMNGIIQVFYRQHYPVEKSLLQGERKDHIGEINTESDKETEKSTKKKKFAVSCESSSLPSFSSSPRYSSFSSAEVSTMTSSQFEQPGEKQIREQPNSAGPTMPFDLKELVKGSINREMRSRREETSARSSMLLLKESSLRSPSRSSTNEWNEGRGKESSGRLSYDDEREMRNKTQGSKLNETPRLSLDSSRSSSSVVAKLMGLEVIADNFETEQRKGNLFCDSPSPRPPALQICRSVDSMKKILLLPAKKQQMKAAAEPTVYGEIQKRLKQLEFKKAGKDLRALKQILEAMEKTQTTSPAAAMNSKSSSIVEAPVSTSLLQRKDAMDLTPRPAGQQDSTKSSTTSPKTLRSRQALVADSCSTAKSGKSQQQSVSPRMQPKKLGGCERQSRPTTPKSEPGKIQRQLGRQQQTESVSPRRKQGIKKPRSNHLQQPDDRVSNGSSDLRSIEVTSKHRLKRSCDLVELQHTPKQKNPDFGTRQERPSLKPLKVSVEQPSPVSVLDAAFDEEDSPSPVRKMSLISFKEDDALHRSEESILLPDYKEVPTQTYSNHLPEEDANIKSGDHKYISEILVVSGLLRDLEYSKISIQLNQARLPINPGLFFFLEQNKASNNMTLLDHRGGNRGIRQQQQTEKLRRKLIFDTINEILAQRFTAEGCCTKPPWFTANPMEKKLEAEELLLQTLCLEIDRLQQENKSKCILEDDIIWEDLQCQGMNMKEFEAEDPWIVLDIERMIFRDLVSEVCFC